MRGGFAGLARPLGLLGFMALLLLLEPDFGAATVLFVTGFGVLFLAGARLRYVLAMLLAAGGSMALLVVFSSYRMRRMTAFLDPWADPFKTGFQLTQSLIAIGRGEWFGVGLGASVQKLFYLPEAHTDFLFAVLAEELGLFGVALTLALFLALAWRAFVIARRAFDAGQKFRLLHRRGLRPLARRAVVHQHRRQHGRAADQGVDAAAHELWPQQPDRHHGVARAGAAGPSRDRAWNAALARGACMSTEAPLALIMAGGTGGHVFPALALARELRARSWRVIWLGTRRGLEARLVPPEHIELEWLTVSGLRGKGFKAWLGAPLLLARALLQAMAVLRRRRPALVVGLGGFVAGPGGVAAWLLRRPLLIHEQNAVAGFTNRCLARLARRVLTAFPGSFAAGIHAEVIGNPVRAEIAALPPPPQRFALRGPVLRLLVLGGSQGAARLNAIVPFALARVGGAVSFEVRHQSGERWFEVAQRNYAEAGVSVRLQPFIDDMAEAYGWADLVICRAGALTISELTAAGVGAILVPFPAATDDHQTRNADFLVGEGAAVMIEERQLSAEGLADQLAALCGGRGRLIAMAERARALARPRAAQALADACVQLVHAAGTGVAA